MSKHQLHFNTCRALTNLYIKKNHDYGDSFGKGYKEYGLIMPVIRLEDKFNRFKQLTKQEAEVKDETIIDTLMDLCNYSIMTIIEIQLSKEPECKEVL